MAFSLFNMVFGCNHRNYSFPQTPKGSPKPKAAELTGTYVTCLDCGKEFPYDWQGMRVMDEEPTLGEPIKASSAVA